jgi:hypothetical protein
MMVCASALTACSSMNEPSSSSGASNAGYAAAGATENSNVVTPSPGDLGPFGTGL